MDKNRLGRKCIVGIERIIDMRIGNDQQSTIFTVGITIFIKTKFY